MSKLSFRARALDAAKPMPIYMTEELPDLPDYSAINRAVPQMPSGMEKEEECEHHLQRAICTGLIIPTPEVSSIEDTESYDRLYTTTYKMPRQLIHMQPFAMEQDIPDYDMDSEDERFVNAQAKKMDLTPLKFEEMMDRLEKGSGQTVVTLQEAKGLLKEDDDLIIAVYDYWLNKRLKTVVPLIPMVKTEHRIGSAANNPYLAFRRRTEKMQTRKNRKNDETSYEKMLKLRRDLSRTVTLLELVKRREKTKRELLHLTIEVFEKRYQAQDFSGQLLAEVSAIKTPRPAFAPIFSNQFGLNQQHWLNKVPIKEEILVPRKEKRQYKRRKHKENIGNVISRGGYLMSSLQSSQDAMASSEEEMEPTRPEFSDLSQCDSEGMFSFRRKLGCNYLPPTSGFGNWPWCGEYENGGGDKRFRYCPTSIATPRVRHIGLARKRIGRGGRVILDRTSGLSDEFWSSMDFTVFDNKSELPLYQPKTPPESIENQWTIADSETAVDSLPNTLIIDVENLEGCENFNSFHTSDDEQSGDNTLETRFSSGGKRGSSGEEAFLVTERNLTTDAEEEEDDEEFKYKYSKEEVVVEVEESSRSGEPETCAVKVCNSKSESEVSDRTRTAEEETERSNVGEGCVSDRYRSTKNCLRFDGTNRVLGQRSRFFCDRKKTEFGIRGPTSEGNRSAKQVFRRNYRIGGFKNIGRWRKSKKEEKKRKRLGQDNGIFTTSEISLPELFAESSVNLIPEPELETNDDSLAILDKLGLDDDFIKKEPEISLDVDGDKGDCSLKTETGQSYGEGQSANGSGAFQRQRLKVDKNIFEFSETDFLKYETDCDVDDLLTELVQNDVVGCCGLFGLTPNSRFNLVSPTYLPLEGDKVDGDVLGEEVLEGVDDKLDGESGQSGKKSDSPTPSNYGQIADISNDIENHEVTLQLKMNRNGEGGSNSENVLTSRINVKNEYSDGYQVGNAEQSKVQHQPQSVPQQTINDIFALNHHNYTISGPPAYNFKQTSTENTQTAGNQVEAEPSSAATGNTTSSSSASGTSSTQSNSNPSTAYVTAGQSIANLLTGQIVRTGQQNVMKMNRSSSAAMGFTKLSSLSGARIPHEAANHETVQAKVVINNAAAAPTATVIGMTDNGSRAPKNEEVVKTTNHDGPGILRTYRGNNARNVHLTSEGNLIVQDPNKKTLSNGPAAIGFNQRRIIRAAVAGQTQGTSLSAQNPTVTQLVTSPSLFTIEGMSPNQNFVAANQNFVVNQGFVTSTGNANFLGANQTVNYVTTNQNALAGGNQLKQATQRKVSLLVNPPPTVAASETVGVDLGNDSLETIDIETSEGDETEERSTSGQEITVDNKKQMTVRKNNSLPMEVT